MLLENKYCHCGRSLDAIYISACQIVNCPYSNDEVLTESEMVTGRDCICGRRNFTEYKDCPNVCVKRALMEGRTDFMSKPLTESNKTIKQTADIIDRLNAYAEVCDITGAYTEANCAYDAIAEIKSLREKNSKLKEMVIESIKTDYPEYKLNYPHNKTKFLSEMEYIEKEF